MFRTSRSMSSARRLIPLVVGLALVPSLAPAADHRDGPRITDYNNTIVGALDLNDLYIFVSPTNRNNTVLIQTMSPGAGIVGPGVFFPGALYELRISNDGNPLTDEIVFQTVFSQPDSRGRQQYEIRRLDGGAVVSRGVTNNRRASPLRGGGQTAAGIFDDPFFFDVTATARFNRESTLAALGRPTGEGNPARHFLPPNFPNNFFGGFNTLAIIIEIPRLRIQSSRNNPNITAWIRSVANIDGLPGVAPDPLGPQGFAQFDRTAIPSLNTVLPIPTRIAPPGPGVTGSSEILDPTRLQDRTNLVPPSSDIANRSTYAARIVSVFGNTQSNANNLVNLLLPDVASFNTTNRSGFPNGRRLQDDVIDTEIQLLTNNALQGDRVVNDSFFRRTFPYIGAPNPVTRVLANQIIERMNTP